jgi:transposase
MYSEVGRTSIDPVILVKLTFIQYNFGIRSMRKTIEGVETNMAYRWFFMVSMIKCLFQRSGKMMSDTLKIQTYLNRFRSMVDGYLSMGGQGKLYTSPESYERFSEFEK